MRLPLASTAALATAIAVAACGGTDTSTPRGTAESFFAALAAGDGGRACELLSPDAQGDVSTQEGEDNLGCVASVGELSGEATAAAGRVELSEPRQDGPDEATVEVEGQLPEEIDFGSLDLVRQGDRWVIDDL